MYAHDEVGGWRERVGEGDGVCIWVSSVKCCVGLERKLVGGARR